MIAGAGCEHIDTGLVNVDPIGKTQFLPDSSPKPARVRSPTKALQPVLGNKSTPLHSNGYKSPYFSRSSFLLIFPTLVLGAVDEKDFLRDAVFGMMPLSAKTSDGS